MIVILDANVILTDPWLRGTQFGTMLDGLRAADGQLAVPSLVIDEVVKKFEERFEKARKKLHSSWDDLNRLCEDEQDPPAIKSAAQAAKEYREWLVQRLKQIGAEILPIPDVTHEKVVARELSRKRPFRAGKGYRDYLIWETVLNARGQVVFVTMNTADFGDGDELHHDLSEDIQRTAYRRDRFDVSWGLRTFNEEYILPQLEQLEEVRLRLEAEGPGSVDLHAWIRRNLEHFLVDVDLLIVGMGMPDGAGSAGLPRLNAAPRVTIEAVWEREPGRYLVRALAKLPVSFSAYFDADDYEKYHEVRKLLEEYMPPGSSADLDWENTFLVRFLFTLAGDPSTILDWDVEEIDSEDFYAY